MGQALEKLFLTKVAQMPQEELELPPPPKQGPGEDPLAGARKGKRGRGRGAPPSKSLSSLIQGSIS